MSDSSPDLKSMADRVVAAVKEFVERALDAKAGKIEMRCAALEARVKSLEDRLGKGTP